MHFKGEKDPLSYIALVTHDCDFANDLPNRLQTRAVPKKAVLQQTTLCHISIILFIITKFNSARKAFKFRAIVSSS